MDKLGNFSFVFAEQEFEDISPESAARLIFLSTYLQYNSDSLFLTRRTPINRTNLPKVLGLSRTTAKRFLDEVSPKYLKLDNSGNLHMANHLFRQGKIGKHGESQSWRKIYIEAVRKLYHSIDKSKHRYLGYVFQMLPFINIQYNVLCIKSDIFEKDLNHIHQLSDKEFCEAIDYDYSAISRLRKVYKNIRFEVDGHTEPFCAFVDTGYKTKIYINPHILYNGTRPDMVAILGSFCQDS